MSRATGGRVGQAGVSALLIGLAALAVPPDPFGARTTWETLLAPYSTGTPVLDGFRVREIRRGPDNGIVIDVRRLDGGAAVEVLVVERGRWTSAHRSRSFTIDYELPGSPAAERDAVTAVVAETIRARDHGLPAPDAVPLRASDSDVLPWGLEMLRGVRGTLAGASLVVLALLVGVRGRGLAYAGIALGTAALAARLVGIPSLRPDVGAIVIVPVAAGLLFAALRGRCFPSRSDHRLASAVAAVAALARLTLGPWGPLHVNGHGARFVAGVVGTPGDVLAYGPGYHEIFAPIAALAPASPDWAIFACNALVSALIPPLAFALGRMTGLGARAAFVAALLLAIDPVAIRMGATEAYFVPIAFLGTAASTALLAALRACEASARWRAATLLVAAGLLLSEAARIHPCAWALMATIPFAVLAGDVGRWRRCMLLAVAAGVVSVGVLLCTSATAVLDVLGNIRTGAILRPASPSPWPLVWVALAAALYGAVAPRPRLAIPAGVSIAAMLLTRHAFDASGIWEQAYFRLYLTLPAVAALACVPPAWHHRRRCTAPAAVLLALVWVGFGWPVVAGRSTEHREYRWVREELRRLPPGCRVVHVAFAGRRVLTLPTYVGPTRPTVAIDPRRRRTVDAALAPAPCLYYVRTSLCSTADGRPVCAAIEERLTLVPVARASFPGARETETFSHDRETVETAIARVTRVASADGR